MSNIDRISISTTVFGPESDILSLPRMLEIIQKAGYDYIEISRKQNDLTERLREIQSSGLKVWSIHGALEQSSELDEAKRRAGVEKEFLRLDDAAPFAPCPYVVHYTSRYLDPARGVAFRKSIEEVYEHAHSLGIILAVETVPYKPKINERYADSKEVADFVRSFQQPDLRMTVDINHSNLRENLVDVARNCNGLIANVHISDNHGEWEDHLPPGEGIIDLPEAFTALRDNGYSGPCNLEFHFPDPAQITPDLLRCIRLRVANTLGFPQELEK